MSLTQDQEAFLKECEGMFSERFTDAEPEFAALHKSNIPSPPIVFPWYGRSRYNNRESNRGGYNRNNDRGSHGSRPYNHNRGYRDSGRYGDSKNY